MQLADDMKREAETIASSSADTFIERMAQRLGVAASASTIFAEPVERDGVTVIPVARARWAFGGGGGRVGKEDGGGGGGGAAQISPVGFIELRDGSAEFRRIKGGAALPLAIFGGLVGLLIVRGIFSRT